MTIIFAILVSIVIVTTLIFLLKNYLMSKSSNQILLLGIELTLVGGIFIIGFRDVLNGIVSIGIILVIIGLLTCVLGFFLKNDKV